MALTFFWRCEGTTFDGTHDYSAGDATPTTTGSVSIDAAASRVGTNGILFDGANAHYAFDGASIFSHSEGSLGFSVRPTLFATNAELITIRGTTSANNNVAVGWLTGNNLFVRHRAAGITNETVTLDDGDIGTTDVWYGVVCRWDAVANLLKIELYDSSGTLLDEVEGTNSIDAASDTYTIRVGESAGANFDGHIDNVFFSDTYEEPIEDNLTITSYTNYGGGGASSSFNGLSLLGVG